MCNRPASLGGVVRSIIGLALLAAGLLTSAAPPGAASPAAALRTASSISSPPSKPGNSGAAFGLQGASNGKPDARGRYNYSASPGGVVNDQIAVENFGTKPVTLAMYATDAYTATNGSFALPPASATPTHVGAWLKLDNSGTITVPARTANGPTYKIVNFTLSVPTDATPGDHAGGIVVALTAKGKGPVKENLVQRVGYRVYVRVLGPLHPGLSVQRLSAVYDGPIIGNPLGTGSLTVKYRVANTGNVELGAKQQIKASPWIGGGASVSSVVPAENTPASAFQEIPPLLPGSFVDVTRVLHGVAPGIRVSAKVTLTPVVPEGIATAQPPTTSASTSTWAIPWPLIIVLAIVLLLISAWWWRRRKQVPSRHSASKQTKVKVGAR